MLRKAMLTDRTKAGTDGDSRVSVNNSRAQRRRSFASVFLVFFGVSLGVIVAEAAVRLLRLGKPEFFIYSATRGWKLRAGASGWQTDEGRAFVSVNRWGYRGADWTRVKPTGTLRIAVLGDSFIEAQQVPSRPPPARCSSGRFTRYCQALRAAAIEISNE